MTNYKCGHSMDTVLLDSNVLSLTAYLEWKDSVGWNGNRTKCWNCFCKEKLEAEIKK